MRLRTDCPSAEPGSARKADQHHSAPEDSENDLSDSSLDRLEERFGQDLAISPAVEAEIKRRDREKMELEKMKSERSRVDSGERERQLRATSYQGL